MDPQACPSSRRNAVRFFEQQENARGQTLWLLLMFTLALLGQVLALNVSLALIWGLDIQVNLSPMLINTCYSFVGNHRAIHVASGHEYVAP